MLAWEMVKISEIIAEFRYSTGPLLGDTIWLFARPWVHCGLWFGFGFAIMKLQLSWIRSNEGILLRAYTGSGSVKLSLTERARLAIIFGIQYLIFAAVCLVDIWNFSVAAIVVPQLFAYTDLNRIYLKANDAVAKV